jgi:hypothetical protein
MILVIAVVGYSVLGTEEGMEVGHAGNIYWFTLQILTVLRCKMKPWYQYIKSIRVFVWFSKCIWYSMLLTRPYLSND